MEEAMNTTIRAIFAALAGLTVVAIFAPGAEAADRFALTCIENKTDLTLNYQIQWGGTNSWENFTISPGGRKWHSYTFTRPNEDKNPPLHVKFNSGLAGRVSQQTYHLIAHSSPQQGDCDRYGKIYRFRYDGTAKQYVDLKDVAD
jgi:hypothetical protein